jgi:hypothetical protein
MSELISIIDDLKGRGVGLKVLTGEGAAIDSIPYCYGQRR